MVSHRRRAMTRYGASYKFAPGPRDRCFYCGDVPQTVDHCPPVDAVYARGADYYTANGIALLKLPACRECNSLLGSREVCCPFARRAFIHERLKRRYKKALRAASWSVDEIEGLGDGMLRAYIQTSVDFCNVVHRRIEYSASNYTKENE